MSPTALTRTNIIDKLQHAFRSCYFRTKPLPKRRRERTVRTLVEVTVRHHNRVNFVVECDTQATEQVSFTNVKFCKFLNDGSRRGSYKRQFHQTIPNATTSAAWDRFIEVCRQWLSITDENTESFSETMYEWRVGSSIDFPPQVFSSSSMTTKTARWNNSAFSDGDSFEVTHYIKNLIKSVVIIGIVNLDQNGVLSRTLDTALDPWFLLDCELNIGAHSSQMIVYDGDNSYYLVCSDYQLKKLMICPPAHEGRPSFTSCDLAFIKEAITLWSEGQKPTEVAS